MSNNHKSKIVKGTIIIKIDKEICQQILNSLSTEKKPLKFNIKEIDSILEEYKVEKITKVTSNLFKIKLPTNTNLDELKEKLQNSKYVIDVDFDYIRFLYCI